MPSLRDTIAELASRLASGVLSAIRDAPMGELLGELDGGGPRGRGARAAAVRVSEPIAPFAGGGRGRTRGGARLPRRSANQIEGVVDRIVALLRANPEGLRSEHIRDQLGLSAKELPRPLKEAERDKKIWKEGQKRATTYFAGDSGGNSRGNSRGKKAAKSGKSAAAPASKQATKASKSVAPASKTRKAKADKKASSAAPPPALASAPAESAT